GRRGETMPRLPLKHRFPSRRESIIQSQIRRDQRPLVAFPHILGRAKLDFEILRLRDGGIGSVKRTIRIGRVGRERQECDTGHHEPTVSPRGSHGVGRKTQIAAGSRTAARTAKNKRSNSGTNKDVRAPAAVPTCPIRWYLPARSSKTSMEPAPQLT